MLEAPDLQHDSIAACLQEAYDLQASRIAFLPLGADVNTAAYRVETDSGTPCFLKARRGVFDETSVALPRFLSDQGIKQIIPPLRTRTGRPQMVGQLWADLDATRLILYPFVEGRNGYEAKLSGHHWAEFGTALRRIHAVKVPDALARGIRQETYTPKYREMVRQFLERVEDDVFEEPVAAELAAFLRTKRGEILDLVARAGCLALTLQAQSLEYAVCHSDIHAGNLLISDEGALSIVDWDEPVLAPKERDLMSIGGGLLASGLAPEEEVALFYAAYGPADINLVALAYYRYERIVQDIATFCEQLLLTDAGGEDRAQSLHYVKSNFLPNGTIDIARRSDATL
jgi:spectinomycin phosphotransferase